MLIESKCKCKALKLMMFSDNVLTMVLWEQSQQSLWVITVGICTRWDVWRWCLAVSFLFRMANCQPVQPEVSGTWCYHSHPSCQCMALGARFLLIHGCAFDSTMPACTTNTKVRWQTLCATPKWTVTNDPLGCELLCWLLLSCNWALFGPVAMTQGPCTLPKCRSAVTRQPCFACSSLITCATCPIVERHSTKNICKPSIFGLHV